MFRNDLILPIVFQFNCNSHPYFSASHEQVSQHQLLCYQQTSRSFRVSSKHLKWKHFWNLCILIFGYVAQVLKRNALPFIKENIAQFEANPKSRWFFKHRLHVRYFEIANEYQFSKSILVKSLEYILNKNEHFRLVLKILSINSILLLLNPWNAQKKEHYPKQALKNSRVAFINSLIFSNFYLNG